MGHLSVWRNAPPNATHKSEILDAAIALKERCPWTLAKPILEQNGVPTGNGWEHTIEEINFHEHLPKVDLDGLYTALLCHICVGEKSVRFFEVGQVVAEQLRDHLKSHAALTALRRPRSKASLKHAAASPPQIECTLQTKHGVFGVYSTIVRKDERVNIDPNSLPADAKVVLQGYDEFIAIRASLSQQFGVIWLPNGGSTVEIRVDYQIGDSQREVSEFHQRMYAVLHSGSGSQVVISPKHLMSAVKNLYNAEDEGTVTDLSFSTTTGSLKTEKMRSATCLRKETFHVGGKKALKTEIEPYRIGLNWLLPIIGTKEFASPSLLLDGNQNDGSALLNATVRKATTFEHYDWVRDKLIEYL